MTRRWLLAALVLGAPLGAQARVGVDPAVVTVGEPFQLVVEVPERGVPLELAVVADSAGTFEPTGERGADPAAGLAWVTLVAWRTGPAATLRGTLRVGGGPARPLTLGTPLVRSVLPADSARPRPRPPRDVLGPDRAVRWGAVLIGSLALLGVIALLWWRRRPRAARASAAAHDPREEALRALRRTRQAGYLERGEVREFYAQTAEALRVYAADSAHALGRDLTSAELVARLRQAAAPGVSALAEVLGAADLAKFAGVAAPADEALREWEVARAWVAGEVAP